MTAGSLPRVAVIGSGIAGLAAAHALRGRARITLFEAGPYFGGHTHTVDVTLPTPQAPNGVTHGVDTGFLVFNERTYPQLIALFAELGVPTAKSDMSFSVQAPLAGSGRSLQWSGSSLNGVFAQRGNLLNGRFLRMLADIARFNRICTQLATSGDSAGLVRPLESFLRDGQFSTEFRDWYFLPMMGCIWSCPVERMLQFPVATMIRFCHNHGLLQVTDRPQWWTVAGGARQYVDKIVASVTDKRLNTPVQRIERHAGCALGGVQVITASSRDSFDKVIVATHSDQALALLAKPTETEQTVLGAIRYQSNRAVLHTDSSVLPQKRAWAAWNYERGSNQDGESTGVCLHYLLNRLQPLPFTQPVIVSLNPLREIARNQVMGEYDYMHPVFDMAAIDAQQHVPALQGGKHSYFCGAWTGYGFHEDGLKSGLHAARLLLADWSGSLGGMPSASTSRHPGDLQPADSLAH